MRELKVGDRVWIVVEQGDELEFIYKPVHDKPKPVAKAHRLITKRRQD